MADNLTHVDINTTEMHSAHPVELDYLSRLWPLYFTSSLLVSAFGILGNALVIHAVRCNKKLHTVSNILILNLAIADVVFLTLCPPFFGFVTQGSWPRTGVGLFGCKAFYYVLHSSLYAAVYSLVAIAIVRYIAIAHEAKTRHLRTRTNCTIMATVIWIVILLANVPIFQSYTLFEWHSQTFCIPDTDELALKICFVFFTFSYVLPLCLIGMVSLATHFSMSSSVLQESSCRQRRRRASKLLCVVVIAFAVLWLPVQIDQLLALYSLVPFSVDYELFRLFLFLMAFCNSAINPVIYNFTSKNFRLAFQQVLCRCQREKVMADNTKTMTTQLLHHRSIKQQPLPMDVRIFRVQLESQTLVERSNTMELCNCNESNALMD